MSNVTHKTYRSLKIFFFFHQRRNRYFNMPDSTYICCSQWFPGDILHHIWLIKGRNMQMSADKQPFPPHVWAITLRSSRTEQHCAGAVHLKMCTINKRVSCEARGVREPASGCTWCNSRHKLKWFSARSFHTRASPWCKSAQRPQRVGLICVKYTPAGAERRRALPLSRFFPPVQILTQLAANPAPWERLCPLIFWDPFC